MLKTLKIEQQEAAAKVILTTEEKERQRIAHELHDGVGQMVSTAKMNLNSILQAPQQNSNLKSQIQTAANLVEEAYQELRHIAHNMAPYALEKNDFSAALFSLINKIDAQVLAINLYTEGLDTPMDKNTASVLYRIIQESVNNVMKHAAATRFDIAVIKDQEGIQVTMEDNGKGFDISQYHEGAGLANIRSRVQFLNGTLDIDAALGKGTLIAVFIPN